MSEGLAGRVERSVGPHLHRVEVVIEDPSVVDPIEMLRPTSLRARDHELCNRCVHKVAVVPALRYVSVSHPLGCVLTNEALQKQDAPPAFQFDELLYYFFNR